MTHVRVSALILFAALAAGSFAQGSGANSSAQAAADALRDFAGADAAFIPAGLLQASNNKGDLSSFIKDATEEVVVVNLTGADLRQAFERSLSMYPVDNNGFLQLSGFEVAFSKTAESGKRVLSISRNGGKVSDGQTFSVAMPASLGRGGFGYFRIWDKAKINKKFAGVTLVSVLKGKGASESSPRWLPQ